MKRIAIYHLETLFWIARLGTFRAAAERLNTTQPAISARVREIEDQLGIALFHREGRRMVLTTRGRRLVQECEPLWVGLEKALLDSSDMAGARGIVRIGTGEIAAASCLPAFVQTIERDLPDVTMEIELDLTARMLQQLLGGTRDIVFLAGPVAAPGIRTAALGSLQVAWVASGATAEAGGFARALPIWSLPSHSPLQQIMLESLEAGNLPYKSINTCNNVRALIDIVESGSGAAILPETMIREQLQAGTLVEILPRPSRRIQFEAAIRTQELDPLVLEIFRRSKDLRIG